MDLPELLRELGVEHRLHGEHHHVSQGWVGMDCPRCSPGTGRFRLGYRLDRASGWCSCWSCGPVHLAWALACLSHKQRRDVEGMLLEHRISGGAPAEKPQGKLVLPGNRGPLRKAHRDYLEGRGFDPDELVDLWGLEGIGTDHRYPWSIFIPASLDFQTVSWTTRALCPGSSGRRYKSAAQGEQKVPLKHLLYGEDMARNAVIVVEGPADAWAIGPGAVAICGLPVTTEQIAKILRYPLRVVAFDAEDAAQRAADALTAQLCLLPGETHNLLFSGKDPASSPRSEILRVRKRYLD